MNAVNVLFKAFLIQQKFKFKTRDKIKYILKQN